MSPEWRVFEETEWYQIVMPMLWAITCCVVITFEWQFALLFSIFLANATYNTRSLVYSIKKSWIGIFFFTLLRIAHSWWCYLFHKFGDYCCFRAVQAYQVKANYMFCVKIWNWSILFSLQCIFWSWTEAATLFSKLTWRGSSKRMWLSTALIVAILWNNSLTENHIHFISVD